MYIRFVPDTLNLLAPKDIRCSFTDNLLLISADIRDIYLANVRNQPLQESEYLMTWEVQFDHLLSRSECCGDDSWLFPLPTSSITNTTNVPLIDYHEGLFGSDPTQPFYYGKFVAARLAIRPTAKSFNEGAILIVMGSPAGRFIVDGIRESPLIPVDQQIEAVKDGNKIKITWKNAVRDLSLYTSFNGDNKIEHQIINGEIEIPYKSGTYEIFSKYNALKTIIL